MGSLLKLARLAGHGKRAALAKPVGEAPKRWSERTEAESGNADGDIGDEGFRFDCITLRAM
jgi:hypothetical protein